MCKSKKKEEERKCCEHNERTTRSPTCLEVIPCTFCVVKLFCFCWENQRKKRKNTGKITNK